LGFHSPRTITIGFPFLLTCLSEKTALLLLIVKARADKVTNAAGLGNGAVTLKKKNQQNQAQSANSFSLNMLCYKRTLLLNLFKENK